MELGASFFPEKWNGPFVGDALARPLHLACHLWCASRKSLEAISVTRGACNLVVRCVAIEEIWLHSISCAGAYAGSSHHCILSLREGGPLMATKWQRLTWKPRAATRSASLP